MKLQIKFGAKSALILIAGGMLLGLGACSTSEKLPCATTDWYELGRRHGARGASENESQNLQMACSTEDEKKDALALYESGRSLGLSEYCTEDNGFEMGRLGHRYLKVCPSILEESFLAGYRRGERKIQLQGINEKLSKPGLPIAKRGLLEGQKLQIQQEDKITE